MARKPAAATSKSMKRAPEAKADRLAAQRRLAKAAAASTKAARVEKAAATAFHMRIIANLRASRANPAGSSANPEENL